MDRNSPDFYCESTAESISETERFVKSMLVTAAEGSAAGSLGPPALPVITPRFVPTCTSELMRGLASIATQHKLLIQSHVSENQGEVEWVKELHPSEASYTTCYDSHGLL